jgi:hypothetical protein
MADEVTRSFEDSPCKEYSFNKCVLPDDSILDTISVDTEDDCQFYCKEVYTDVCLFHIYVSDRGNCTLANYQYKLYLDLCEDIAVPPNSTIDVSTFNTPSIVQYKVR